MYLISACLIGLNTTYNKKNHLHQLFQWLVEAGRGIPFCPEQLGGLCTPRPPSEIKGGDGSAVLKKIAKVLNDKGEDVSEYFIDGAYETLKLAQLIKPEMVILKERSPSCGVNFIYDGTFTKNIIQGVGTTTALLQFYGFKTISDEDFLKMKKESDM
jgi:uncharacterized protein YbbK (DUF523 family)